MKSENSKTVKKAFTCQADKFESDNMRFSKQEYLDYAVSKASPSASDTVLEVPPEHALAAEPWREK